MSFLARFGLALVVVSVVYVIPLRLVNPEGDFRDGLLPPIVVDARAWKMSELRAGGDVRKYDAIVLGSSRSMQLGREIDARYGVHTFNFAVDSARAEDYLAIYHWAKRIGMAPRVLALGLDLEALDDADQPDERYSRNAELVGALGERDPAAAAIDALANTVGSYKRMFSTWYVADAARSVSVHLAPSLPPEIEAIGDDGVLRYPRWDAQRAAGTFDLGREIAPCIPLYIERFRDMHALSTWRMGLLEQLLREARDDGVTVVVWLTPLHAQTIERLSSSTGYAPLTDLAKNAVGTLATRYGARFRDLSDPASFGATAEGWYDCAHLDQTNLVRLVQALPR
jgi:hypothetical protein